MLERLHLWNKVKIFLRTEASTNHRSVGDLLQALKYSSQTSSFFDELRQAFVHDLHRPIGDTDFRRFQRFAENDAERPRSTLQSLFPHISIPDETTRRLCTIQQWAHLKYRLARLEEVARLIEAKVLYVVEHSDGDANASSFVDGRHLALASSEDD